MIYNMVINATVLNFDPHLEEILNAKSQKLYDILHSSERVIWWNYMMVAKLLNRKEVTTITNNSVFGSKKAQLEFDSIYK